MDFTGKRYVKLEDFRFFGKCYIIKKEKRKL